MSDGARRIFKHVKSVPQLHDPNVGGHIMEGRGDTSHLHTGVRETGLAKLTDSTL